MLLEKQGLDDLQADVHFADGRVSFLKSHTMHTYLHILGLDLASLIYESLDKASAQPGSAFTWIAFSVASKMLCASNSVFSALM